MRSRTPLTRRVIAALLMVPLTGCYSWQPTTVSPAGWTPEERPSSVRATLTSGRTIILEDPTMRNDSITGIVQDPTGYRRTVAVSDVSTVEVRRIDTVMSMFFAVFIPVLAIGAIKLNDFSNSW